MSEKEELSVVRPELLQIAESVARDKSIEQTIVIEAMEQAIQSVAKKKYGQDLEVKASIDEKTGEIKVSRVLHVVSEIEDTSNQISLEKGKEYDINAKLGDTIYDPLPPIDFGRVAAQTAKQVIVQRVKEADKERQYNEYQEKQGQIVNGVVKRVEYGNVFLDLGKAEAYMRKDETISRETFRPGDRVRGFITQVKKDLNGPQIFLSRTCNEFMSALFSQEVPEIYDGIIEIISVARDPGSRAKIAVLSKDKTIDPVGACVGMRGSRIQAVVRELNNEKIDIVNFSEQPEILITRALSPAKPVNLYIDEDKEYCIAIFEDENLDSAIGRNGMNINLASKVTGYRIDAYGVNQYKRLQNDQNTALADIEGITAKLSSALASENIETVNDLMDAEEESLVDLKGITSLDIDNIYSMVQAFIEREVEVDEESDNDISSSPDSTSNEEE